MVELSYLKDFVCPFSRKTFITLGRKGTHDSKVDGWGEKECAVQGEQACRRMTLLTPLYFDLEEVRLQAPKTRSFKSFHTSFSHWKLAQEKQKHSQRYSGVKIWDKVSNIAHIPYAFLDLIFVT